MSEVTSLATLSLYAQGQLVELPGFGEGQPFFARLRRPSILGLTKSGKIPNALVKSASKLFNGKGVDDNNDQAMGQAFEVFDALCEAAFVEPKYQDIKNAGIELTDEQYMAVFNYTQRGVDALAPFRRESANTVSAGDSAEV